MYPCGSVTKPVMVSTGATLGLNIETSLLLEPKQYATEPSGEIAINSMPDVPAISYNFAYVAISITET